MSPPDARDDAAPDPPAPDPPAPALPGAGVADGPSAAPSGGPSSAPSAAAAGPSDEDPEQVREGALRVVRALRAAGFEALFAGGCVRDQVMGLVPKDYDIATSATPEQVLAVFDHAVPVGAQFGVVMVIDAGHPYEVATFRSEEGYSDGRRPDAVAWSTAREDVQRRDFTINGLLIDPLAEGDGGRVIDHVGGLDDLRAGVVRAIGDPEARFAEDKLRILRAVRFAARLGFAIDPRTWDAVCRHAPDITPVSAERVRDELQRLLTEGGAARGLALLVASGLMPYALPEVPDPARARERFEGLGPLPPEIAWPLLLLDAPGMPEAAEAWGQRHRVSKALARHTGQAIRVAREAARWDALPVAARKRLVRRPEAPAGLEVAARAADAGQLDRAAVTRAREAAAAWTEEDLHPPRLVTGHDLASRGHATGPGFAAALAAAEDAQLEGRVTTREEALAVAARALEAARGGAGDAA